MAHRRPQSAIRRHPHLRPMFAGLRHYARKDAVIEVLVVDEDGDTIPFESVNVSESGVFLASSFLYEVGQVHRLILRSADGRSIEVRGRVVRVVAGRKGEPSGMGYEFLRTDRSTFDGLTNLVASL